MRHEGALASAHFSPDGRWVVTASDDGTAQVCDVLTGETIGRPIRLEGRGSSAQVTSDGWRLVTTSRSGGNGVSGTARVWLGATGKALIEQGLNWDSTLRPRFSPDGRWVVTVSADNVAEVWEAQTGKPV